jgi:shikimate dehydrogenase
VDLSQWRYQLLPVPPALFAETAAALPGAGFRGANVTIPHKEAALALADSPSSAAEAIGAANTLVFEEDGRISAENTDAPGLIASLPFSAAGKTALVLGAGGTARAAVWALRGAGAAEIRVWNRHGARARLLAAALGAQATAEVEAADLLVHCTPVGLSRHGGGFKQLPVGADELAMFGCVVDFAYSRDETVLVRSARAAGVPVVDGLDLLVCQGALSFERFTGLSAPLEEMRAAARGR